MSSQDERLAALEAQVEALLARVAALEHPQPPPPSAAPVLDLDLLQRMQERSGPPYEEGPLHGAVTYAGAAQIEAAKYLWQIERPLPGLLALEPEPLAQILAALGNPTRLSLVRALLGGPQSSQQLQAALGDISTGQLYHHLKELRAAGIIEQQSRSDYRIAARNVVPFLIVLAGAFDLLGGAE